MFSTNYIKMKKNLFVEHTPRLIAEVEQQVKLLFDEMSSSLKRERKIYEENLSKLFVQSSPAWRFQMYKMACFHQELLVKESVDQEMSSKLRRMNIPLYYFKKPGLILTFHFGSYRLLLKWLTIHKIPITLVVSRSVKNEQEVHFWNTLKPFLHYESDFNVLDADYPNVLFKIRKALVKGHYVVLFIDGNRGAMKHTNKFKFGDLSLKIPTTIAEMAYKFNIPVYPMWSKREQGGIQFFLHDSAFSFNNICEFKNSRRDAGIKCFENIFQIFNDDFIANPWQWECCFYLADFM